MGDFFQNFDGGDEFLLRDYDFGEVVFVGHFGVLNSIYDHFKVMLFDVIGTDCGQEASGYE